MRETDPISLHPRLGASRPTPGGSGTGTQPGEHRAFTPSVTVFTRHELSEIFAIYGRMVAAGEWRDYALDMGAERAVFSIFRRTSECPLFRIEKVPKLARKQGAYSVVSAGGLILKRGHELARVISVLDRKLRVVE